MRRPISLVFAVAVTASVVMASACATSPTAMDGAALKAYASKPWDKAAMMHTTVDLGTYNGVPVMAEFPCSDVCPQYTKRIIHYRLPADTSCASVGGVEKQVLVPIAIAVRMETFCIPEPLVASGLYDSK
jgi:hypothetical protein